MDMIDDFVERKWGRRKVEFLLPPLEEILKDSYGVIVYQEQVMRIANVLASYSLGEADILRRAMGKKDPKAMAEQRNRFITGAAKLGHPKAAVDEIFEQMAKVFRVRIQQVALGGLRAGRVPDGVFENALSGGVHGGAADVGNVEARQRGEVHRRMPRDGHSRGAAGRASERRAVHAAHIEDRQAIRFGLAAVKNVGGNAIESILKARAEAGGRFKSFWEFCEKVDLRLMNKRVIESLIKAGALDSLGTRGQLMAAVDKAMERAQKAQRDAEQGQSGLFGLFDETPARGREADALPAAADWEESERLANEKEVLGSSCRGIRWTSTRKSCAT
jgi:DNA polymerase III subunit alpha